MFFLQKYSKLCKAQNLLTKKVSSSPHTSRANVQYFKGMPSDKKKREQPRELLSRCVSLRKPAIISCRVLRQKQRASYGLWHDEKPKRDDRWQSPCADGNHACCFACDCGVGTFFSLLYISILLYFESVDARAPYFPKRKVNDYSSSCQKNGRKMTLSMRSAQFSVRNSRKLRCSHSPFAKRAACSAMRSASSK